MTQLTLLLFTVVVFIITHIVGVHSVLPDQTTNIPGVRHCVTSGFAPSCVPSECPEGFFERKTNDGQTIKEDGCSAGKCCVTGWKVWCCKEKEPDVLATVRPTKYTNCHAMCTFLCDVGGFCDQISRHGEKRC